LGLCTAALGQATLRGAAGAMVKEAARDQAENLTLAALEEALGVPVPILPRRRRRRSLSTQHGAGKGIDVASSRAVTKLERISASEVNAPFVAKGYGPPYYSEGAQVRRFTTGQDMRFVRVHGAGNQQGAFIVRSEEITGMTAQQIQQHLALPRVPTHISDVHVPPGARIRMGRVARQPAFGVPDPGGIQYELLDQIPASSFQNMRPLQ
jgi:hypothetical protein